MFGKIGVTAMGGDSKTVVEKIIKFENNGIKAAWLTTGGAGVDGLTIFAAAAMATESILLGTCITPTYPRHPITQFFIGLHTFLAFILISELITQ